MSDLGSVVALVRDGCATATMTVDDARTAIALGSGDVQVLGTPALIALMELAARSAAAPALAAGQTTVGTSIQMEHLAPSPVGARVTAEATIVERTLRRIDFALVAKDATSGVVIGRGTHQRAVVDRVTFLARALAKG